MSAVLLLGAGASYGSGDCHPYPPPLGRDLFAELQRSGGVAASVTGDLAARFASNFEDGMAAFREIRDLDSTAFLREMGAYFAQFSAGPANLYVSLGTAVRSARRRVTVATTNYETLLEQAFSRDGHCLGYGAPAPAGTIGVLKIHGSCNFLPDIGTNVFRGVTFSGNGSNFEGPTRIAWNNADVLRFCRDQDSLAPAIALYAPGKKVLFCPAFVRNQQSQFSAEVVQATTVYVVGMRVLPADGHIWDTLARSKARLEYVGLEPDDFLEWAAGEQRKNVNVLEATLDRAIPLIRIQLAH